MRFYRPRSSPHPSVLWDPKTGWPIYAFSQGVFETQDPQVIALLKMLNFPEAPVDPRVQVAQDRQADLAKPAPPPPPNERTVPAVEPPGRAKGVGK